MSTRTILLVLIVALLMSLVNDSVLYSCAMRNDEFMYTIRKISRRGSSTRQESGLIKKFRDLFDKFEKDFKQNGVVNTELRDKVLEAAVAVFRYVGVIVSLRVDTIKRTRYLSIEPLTQGHALNRLAYSINDMGFELRFNPSILVRTASKGALDREGRAIYVPNALVSTFKPESTMLHEIMHVYFMSLFEKYLFNIFHGKMESLKPEYEVTPTYKKKLEFEELATFPYSMFLESSELLRILFSKEGLSEEVRYAFANGTSSVSRRAISLRQMHQRLSVVIPAIRKGNSKIKTTFEIEDGVVNAVILNVNWKITIPVAKAEGRTIDVVAMQKILNTRLDAMMDLLGQMDEVFKDYTKTKDPEITNKPDKVEIENYLKALRRFRIITLPFIGKEAAKRLQQAQ